MTRETALEYLHKWFGNSVKDYITLEEAYASYNRDVNDVKRNREWLRNRVMHLKNHKLVESVYRHEGKVLVLDKIALTSEGKQVLERTYVNEKATQPPSSTDIIQSNKVESEEESIFTNLVDIISELSKRNANRNIEVDINVKKGEIMTIRLA